MCNRRTIRAARLAACGLLALALASVAQAADWPTIDPALLALTAEPLAPAAPAIYLLRQVDRDDERGDESNTLVIKILTEEGRRYADVRIEYSKSEESIVGIDARTIRPDGTIVKFDGTVYDAPLAKARGVKLMTKTFTLPDVEVGSVIEYRYRRATNGFYVYNSQWVLNDELFTKHGVFTLHPNPYLDLVWRMPIGLPVGATTPSRSNGRISMEVHDVPAFVTEEAMPPESALKFRVEFDYSSDNGEQDFNKYWKHFAKNLYSHVDSFIDHRRAMQKALEQIIDPADPPMVRLQKIYDRVQRLRNTAFDLRSSQVERERDQVRANDDAADVWERGYGSGYQITWLFLALVRAAGLEADPVEVSTRNEYFFNPALRIGRSLNTNVVRVRVGEREIFADPGIPRAPLGMLPWHEAGVEGLVITKDGGTWIETPLPPAMESRLERRATFALGSDGTLDGHLTVTFHGLQALTRRLSLLNDDAAARKESLEREVKSFVPVGVDVVLTNVPDWDASSPTLRAEFDVRVPGFAQSTGSRLLLAAAVFRAEEQRMFTHATRVHPIYFEYPYTDEDVVAITVPAGFQPTGLPDPTSTLGGGVKYRCAIDFHDGVLTARRTVEVDGFLFQPKSYGPLHQFYQIVRTGDEQQIVLSRANTGTAR